MKIYLQPKLAYNQHFLMEEKSNSVNTSKDQFHHKMTSLIKSLTSIYQQGMHTDASLDYHLQMVNELQKKINNFKKDPKQSSQVSVSTKSQSSTTNSSMDFPKSNRSCRLNDINEIQERISRIREEASSVLTNDGRQYKKIEEEIKLAMSVISRYKSLILSENQQRDWKRQYLKMKKKYENLKKVLKESGISRASTVNNE